MTNQKRDTKEITTPIGGIKVVLHTWLTGREKRKIQEPLMEANFNVRDKKASFESMKAKVAVEVQDRTLEAVVVSVGGKTTDIVDTILDMRAEDSEFVQREVDKVVSGDQEKKTK